MIRRALVLCGLLISVAACGREPSSPTSAATPPAITGSDAAAQTPPSSPTPSAPEAAPAETEAQASQESTGDAAVEDRSDATLERLAQLPPQQQLPDGRWKAGQHYRPLSPAQPTGAPAGKVQVVEVFWYGCSHCYALEPFLQSWDKNNAAYIEYVKVPVIWDAGRRAHARLFYALQALGKEEELTPKVFDEIHQRRNMLLGSDEQSTRRIHAELAARHGIPEKEFLAAYDSFSVNSNVQRAEQLTRRYQVEGVPLMVVAGKYVTDVGMAGGQNELLALLNDLAASEKRR
jgi:thiol:disulfide interchange protein DsbA